MHLIKKLMAVALVCLPVTGWCANIHYTLDVQINTAQKKITGIAWLKAQHSTKIRLSAQHLDKLEVDGHAVSVDADNNIILTVPSDKDIRIRYETVPSDFGPNFIDRDHVFLRGGWYPQPDVLVEYALSVTLPKNFIAVSEADITTAKEFGGFKTFSFQFEHPLDTLHLAASTQYISKSGRYKDVAVEVYFFKEDAHLADEYIAYTQTYLKMYEEMLTPYPYRRFAIVENIFPTGESMPTYTLLGNQVVRLPFITQTSLGHEILHQWFGNCVYIDFTHGNWAEGLTTYLADHHFAELQNKDTAYRKKIMVDYDAYVNAKNAMPLSDFFSRHNKAQSAVGYGKSAMIFHELKVRYGEETFLAALKAFILQNLFHEASWNDIQKAFEKVTGQKMSTNFNAWLDRKDIPQIKVEDAQLQVEQGRIKLNFFISQPDEAYALRIPVSIYTDGGKSRRYIDVKASKENISLTLDDIPTRVVLDENYDIMRQLTPEEIPAVLAGIMGKDHLIAVVSTEKRDIYQPLFDAIGTGKLTYAFPDELAFTQIKENSLLIAGYDTTIAAMLFGKLPLPADGVRLRVYKNPYNPKERIALLHVANKTEAQAVKAKLPHYGRYTDLAFDAGLNTIKETEETHQGIQVLVRPETRGIAPDHPAALARIIPDLPDCRIIYVGERHDQFAHHINQLQIIKTLHESGQQLAVGMEMFARTHQQAVDDYLAGRSDEYAFLQQSDYFNQWRYDYNLYKPIIDYLKQQQIPLVALNIAENIAHKVAREGIHGLSDNEKEQLPAEMDLSNERYRDHLESVFTLHANQEELKNFNNFLQAQVLWDETMAESAQRFLAGHPQHKMVILAGNGHVRHKFGIPERLYRRNQEPFAVLVQDDEIESGIADYVLLTEDLKGEAPPRLGVMVDEKGHDLVVTGVRDNSPAGRAGWQKGDIIKQAAKQPINSLSDLKLVLFYSKMGSKLKVQLQRDDKTLDTEVELFRF